MKEKIINKEIKSHIMSIAFIIAFLLIGTIYIYYPNKENLLSSLIFLQNREKLYIEELSEGIKLAEAYPISDEEGLTNDSYQFKIRNESNEDIHYQIIFKNQLEKIIENNLSPLASKYLRYSVQEENGNLKIETLSEDEIIYDAIISANSEITFDFRVWLGENFDDDAMGKTFIGRMEVVEI